MSAALEELISVTLRRSRQGHNKVSTLIENVDRHCPYLDEQIVILHDRNGTITCLHCIEIDDDNCQLISATILYICVCVMYYKMRRKEKDR